MFLTSSCFKAPYSNSLASHLHGKDHNSSADLMPSKGVGHPDFCNKVEENDNDNGGSAPSLDSEGEDDVGDGVEGEKVEDSVAKEVGGQHCARHHACGMAQPGNNLFARFENPSEHRSQTYLNGLCDNSEE